MTVGLIRNVLVLHKEQKSHVMSECIKNVWPSKYSTHVKHTSSMLQ